MLLWTLGCVIFTCISCTQGRCHCNELTVHYDELGCTPVYVNQHDCCPVYYNCTEFESRQNGRKCYFSGATYSPGQRVNEMRLTSPCFQKCKCDGVGSVNFKCSHRRCTEEVPEHGCFLKYRTDSCCSLGSACVPFNATETCFDGDRVSLEGEKYTPPDVPCTDCICERPQSGTGLHLVCKRKYCATDLVHAENARQNCAPIYDEQHSCCPTNWKCPQSADQIVPAKNRMLQTNAFCRYGNMNLHVGDTINGLTIEIDNLKCECRVPPFVTCMRKHTTTDDLGDK
ncbi:hypothetical protein CBL_12590 [Carabus blaptoides fortunei]